MGKCIFSSETVELGIFYHVIGLDSSFGFGGVAKKPNFEPNYVKIHESKRQERNFY